MHILLPTILCTGKRFILLQIKMTELFFRFTADEEGDYKFCLDNTFSRFSNKIVFFEILTDDADPNWNFENFEDLELDDVVTRYEMKLEDFRVSALLHCLMVFFGKK